MEVVESGETPPASNPETRTAGEQVRCGFTQVLVLGDKKRQGESTCFAKCMAATEHGTHV